MKTSTLAKENNFKVVELNEYINETNFPCVPGFIGLTINDEDVDWLIAEYRQYLVNTKEKKMKKEAAYDLIKKERLLKEEATKLEENNKQAAMSQMLITSGFTFEGFAITKYSGYISGDAAIEVERGIAHGAFKGMNTVDNSRNVSIFSKGVTNVGDALMASLTQMRREALTELKEAAYDLGCNAVIGVDFDYLTLDPQTATDVGGTAYLPYVFGVTANGNAVIIEKK